MFMHQLSIGWYVNYAKQQGQRTIYITRWKLWAGDVEIRCPLRAPYTICTKTREGGKEFGSS